MTREAFEAVHASRSWAYPMLKPEQKADLDAKLVAVAALRHPGGLTTVQLADLAAAIDQQTRHLETLHRFRLTNADEPAFIRSPLGPTG